MKRFRFSLETVLRVKRSREEKAQRDFSAVLEKRAVASGKLLRLEIGLQEMIGSQSGKLKEKGLVDRFEAEQFDVARGAILERIRWQRAELIEIETELDAKRLALVEASRDRKVLEKLEDSQFQAYLKKSNREEQAFLDELAQFGAREDKEPAPPNSAA